VDPLSRGLVWFLLIVLVLAGCGGDDGEPAAAPSVAPSAERPEVTTPALPDGVMLQLFVPETGELYRVAEDGRYTVNERSEKPRSKYEPGRETVSEQGLGRLRKALEQVSFFSLPAQVETGDCVSDDVVIRNSGRKVLRRTVVFSARDGSQEATVEGRGDFAAPCTLAELEPIYRALDLEALGDWQVE
jgi:hypothetical protein